MKKRYLVPIAALAIALVTMGNSCETTQDRSDAAGGNRADDTADMSNIVVWRNIDDAPNLIVACVDGVKVVTTRTRAEGGADVEVMPDFAQNCQR